MGYDEKAREQEARNRFLYNHGQAKEAKRKAYTRTAALSAIPIASICWNVALNRLLPRQSKDKSLGDLIAATSAGLLALFWMSNGKDYVATFRHYINQVRTAAGKERYYRDRLGRLENE